MDAKSLREAMKDKAKRLASGTSEKVDSSTFTPAEPLDADVKTGMRPISRRAFKTGGKVDGGDMKHHAGRTARKAGGRVDVTEKIGLANTDQKTANEDRDGKKHVGGFKKGGSIKKAGGGGADSGQAANRGAMPEPTQADLDRYAESEESGPEGPVRPMRRPLAPFTSPVPRARASAPTTDLPIDAEGATLKRGGKAKKDGGPISSAGSDAGGREARKSGGKANWIADAIKKPGALKKSLHVAEDKTIPEAKLKKAEASDNPKLAKRARLAETLKGLGKKDGGWEGSAKDEAQDKKLAKKYGMSMKAWEKSKADEKHDEQKSMKGIKHGGDCTCAKCSGGARMARKDGGKVKGKTNINIIISPHHDGSLGSMGNQPVPPVALPIVPPRPPVAAVAPMPTPMPGPVAVPPGLGQTMPAAAGVPPSPPPGVPPMMARKDGGKVSYPKMRFGAGSGEGRLEKIEKYGKNA